MKKILTIVFLLISLSGFSQSLRSDWYSSKGVTFVSDPALNTTSISPVEVAVKDGRIFVDRGPLRRSALPDDYELKTCEIQKGKNNVTTVRLKGSSSAYLIHLEYIIFKDKVELKLKDDAYTIKSVGNFKAD